MFDPLAPGSLPARSSPGLVEKGGAAPPEPGAPSLNRRLVSFDPISGDPVVVNVPTLAKSQVTDAMLAAVSLPYDGPEPSFAGLTLLEVMVIRLAKSAAATGDRGDVETILDRVIGKPKQTSENLNVHASYEDYVREIEAKEEARRREKAIPVDMDILS